MEAAFWCNSGGTTHAANPDNLVTFSALGVLLLRCSQASCGLAFHWLSTFFVFGFCLILRIGQLNRASQPCPPRAFFCRAAGSGEATSQAEGDLCPASGIGGGASQAAKGLSWLAYVELFCAANKASAKRLPAESCVPAWPSTCFFLPSGRHRGSYFTGGRGPLLGCLRASTLSLIAKTFPEGIGIP